MAIEDRTNDGSKKRSKQENIVVYGICSTRSCVENAVSRLRERGFRMDDVSVLFPTPEGSREFAHTNETKAPEGVTVGATTGAIIGGTLGWLAGIGAVAIPGVGPFIAAGPIMGMLAGMGTGGLIGGLTGLLVGMGIPEYEAKRYEGRIKDGGILISVHCDNDDWKQRARRILEESGVEDISASGESSADYEAPDPRGSAHV